MDEARERGRNFVAWALILAAGFVAYANTLDGGWVWDDASSVLLHRHVQQPAWLLSAWRSGEMETPSMLGQMAGAFGQLFVEDQHAFGRGQGNFYRPLLSTTFALDYMLAADSQLFAPRAPGAPAPEPGVFWFHVQSILWHLAAASALLAVLIRLAAPWPVRFAVPLIWVLHPLHTEAVAYISGRADMMSGAFLFAGVYFGLSRANGARRYLAWMAAALCYALGLASKEATLILPAVLAVALVVRALGEREQGGKSGWLRALLPVLPCLGVAAAYVALRVTLLSFAEPAEAGAVTPFLGRLYETLQSFGLYVAMLFIPTGLHMERTLDGVGLLAALGGMLALGLLAGGAAFALRAGAWRATLGVALFLLCWLPISGLFPLNAPLAEHWMYVPMAGFWLALAELCARLPRPGRVVTAITAALLCLLFAGLTAQRNTDWDNNTRLFEATLRENPKTLRVHYNLAVTLGDIEGNAAGALRHYAESVALAGTGPERLEAGISQAGLLLDAARPMEALNALATATAPGLDANSPGWVHAESTLAIVRGLVGLGRLADALNPEQMAAVVKNLDAAGVLAQNQQVGAAMESIVRGAPLAESLHLPGLLDAR
ncbi:MAG: hypothetical protein RLZZ303_3326 [Candidatus Hydrogenedentota bacterium]